jgi:C4-dicarboxylate-specific signal transduction histidine kinase
VTSAVPGFYSARRFDFPHKGQFVLVVKSNVLSFDERKDGREFVYAVDSDSNIILTNDRGAAGKRLFSDAQKSDGYLESVFTSGERLKFKGRNAVFYKEEAEVSGLRVAVVQIDDFHLFRLIGFGVGTLLLLSALLSALFVIFFFVSTQERVVEAERARKLEKENADTRAMLFHQDKLASLGFLSAGVAHEINNPLTVVTAVLTHIREVLSDAANFPHRESFLSLVDNATNASWRIANIVKRLLAFARTDKGELGPVSTHAVVQEAYEMVRYVLEKNSVELILQTHGDSPLIRANSGELGQVLLNLLTNAKDALSGTQNARIVLSVDENSESVFIRCSDNGPGVPETLRQKVFEPFFTTKEVGKGTGLGLAISSTLVASMGGRLRLETSETGGATFLLIFPKFNGAS